MNDPVASGAATVVTSVITTIATLGLAALGRAIHARYRLWKGPLELYRLHGDEWEIVNRTDRELGEVLYSIIDAGGTSREGNQRQGSIPGRSVIFVGVAVDGELVQARWSPLKAQRRIGRARWVVARPRDGADRLDFEPWPLDHEDGWNIRAGVEFQPFDPGSAPSKH